MKNLVLSWLKCLALVICIPVMLCVLPFAALIDGALASEFPSYRERLIHYYTLFSQLEVRIEPKW